MDSWRLFYASLCPCQGFRAFATAKDGSKCLAMEYGGEQSLNDLIEKRRENGLKAFPAANVEKVALHVARGLRVKCALESNFAPCIFLMFSLFFFLLHVNVSDPQIVLDNWLSV